MYMNKKHNGWKLIKIMENNVENLENWSKMCDKDCQNQSIIKKNVYKLQKIYQTLQKNVEN